MVTHHVSDHCFTYCSPESLVTDLCYEKNIVDAHLLMDDRTSYGVGTLFKKPHDMIDELASSGTRFHTIIHRDSKSS